MPLLPWVKQVFWRRRRNREDDLQDEIQSHLRMAMLDRVERGETLEGARLSARSEFGNVGLVMETTRGMWTRNPLEAVAKDLRYAVRMLHKNPGFSAIAILVLALGIGANTAIFGIVNAVLLRPLPFPQSRQLARIWESSGKRGNAGPVSYPTFRDWQDWNHTFSGIAAFSTTACVLTGEGEAVHLEGVLASANLFEVLDVQPMRGRRFLPEEDLPEANHGSDSVIISHSLWQGRFFGDANILRRKLVLDGRPYSVVGVMPPGFDSLTGGPKPDFWLTAASLAEPGPNRRKPLSEEREIQFLGVIGRLKPGTPMALARADMDRVAALTRRAHPESNSNEGATLADFQQSITGDIRPVLLLLLSAAGMVLLIACADISGLVLARVTRRQREITVRAAIGAGKWRIVRQLLVESLLLAAIGGAAKLLRLADAQPDSSAASQPWIPA